MKNTDGHHADSKRFSADLRPPPPKPAPARGPWKETEITADPLFGVKQEVLAVLRGRAETVFGLFDAAMSEGIPLLLHEHAEPAGLPDDPRVDPPPDDPTKCEYESLYVFGMRELERVGPWLVRLPKESVLLERLVMEGWGKSWGWYIASHATLYSVRKHFRHFTMARLPSGEAVHFRVADPRVAGAVLRAAPPDQVGRRSMVPQGALGVYEGDEEGSVCFS